MFRMGRTALQVNIQAIGAGANRGNLGTQFVEYALCNIVGRAIRAVDDNLQTFKCKTERYGAFTKLDITPGRIFNPLRLSQPIRLEGLHRLFQLRLNGMLNLIRQLAAFA